MSNQPTKKMWGYLLKDEVEKVTKMAHLVKKNEKYGNQIAVKAAEWDNGNISIQVWDPETKTAVKILTLRPDNGQAAPSNALPRIQKAADDAADDDFPF